MQKLCIGLFALCLLVGCKKAPIETKADFKAYLEDEMERQHLPTLAVLLFEQDQILHEEYLGQSQVESNTALKSDHVFLMASVSKMITATALLQLYDEGKFDLDDKINDYLPFAVNVPNSSTDITFRMLLTHTSGIADGSALDGQYYDNQDSPVALSDFMQAYFTPSGAHYDATENFHDAEAGEEHQYSNAASALIGVLVEEISGKGFNAYCKQEIFTPLGMNHTAWRLDEVTTTKVQPYDYVSGDYEKIEHYTFTDYPNGGLRSTANDMFLFLRTFVQNGTSNGHQLLKASTIEAMFSPQIPDIDEQVGLHAFVMNEDEELWGHDGGEKGVATIVGFNKTTGVGAIVLTNQGEANLDDLFLESYLFALELRNK